MRGDEPGFDDPVNDEADLRDAPFMDRLRALSARADPVPASVVSAAKGSFVWRTIDAELAELVYDSALDTENLALVRSSEAPRFLTFEAPELSVEVEVSVEPAGLLFDGLLAPARRAVVEIQHRDGAISTETDARGRFRVGSVVSGPVRMVCNFTEPPGTPVVETDWFVL